MGAFGDYAFEMLSSLVWGKWSVDVVSSCGEASQVIRYGLNKDGGVVSENVEIVGQARIVAVKRRAAGEVAIGITTFREDNEQFALKAC